MQPAPAAFDGDARKAYVTSLLKHLNQFKRYPEAAKLRHEQGVVFVRFMIDRSGHVLSTSIARSSGSKTIDAEMLEAVKRADPLPRIPDIFGREQLDLIVGRWNSSCADRLFAGVRVVSRRQTYDITGGDPGIRSE